MIIFPDKSQNFINYSLTIVCVVTTIQLREGVKRELERLKNSSNETYEDVILGLMKIAEEQKRRQRFLLRDGYREMASESLVVASDWDAASGDWE